MFAQEFGTNFVLKHYESLMKDLKVEKFDKLPLLHHLTSGMKSFCT
jgi:hypothetical protein